MPRGRLEAVRERVDEVLEQLSNPWARRCGCVHLYGVSETAVLLAARRELDPELAAVAGMLHDLSTYKTGDPKGHAQASSQLARELLAETGSFSQHEIDLIATAIGHHSTKEKVHGPFDELLKDADVLQHRLHQARIDATSAASRFHALVDELALR